jgi:hypothetical protein
LSSVASTVAAAELWRDPETRVNWLKYLVGDIVAAGRMQRHETAPESENGQLRA